MAVDIVQARLLNIKKERKVLAEYIKPIINRHFLKTVIIYYTK